MGERRPSVTQSLGFALGRQRAVLRSECVRCRDVRVCTPQSPAVGRPSWSCSHLVQKCVTNTDS